MAIHCRAAKNSLRSTVMSTQNISTPPHNPRNHWFLGHGFKCLTYKYNRKASFEQNMSITKSQSVSGNCKGHAVPAALTGAARAQLQATVNPSCWSAAEMLNHHWITHETSQVNTLVYPSSLSGRTQRLLNTEGRSIYSMSAFFNEERNIFKKKWRKKYCELYLEAFFVNKLGECNILYMSAGTASLSIFFFTKQPVWCTFLQYPGQSFEVLCMYWTLSQKLCNFYSMYACALYSILSM